MSIHTQNLRKAIITHVPPKHNKKRRGSVTQQILDLTIQLEASQQELALVQLEKLEYEKEVFCFALFAF